MSTIGHTIADARTMLRRNLIHMLRYPALTMFLVLIPVLLLVMFVYVFGGTLGAGLPGGAPAGSSNTSQYLAYVVPGILLIGVAGIANGASIGVAQDMTTGIIARFRSMSISRAAVLTGHVLGNTVQGLICLAIVLGIAIALGFRPAADPLHWVLVIVFLTVVCIAVSWVSVGMGMSAKTVETASNTPMIFTLLPFLGSGFVPTTSMPDWLRVFADWQPFTPIIETTRALLAGHLPDTRYGVMALVWCAVMVIGGYIWSRWLYVRRSVS